jgi:hypothetical protein
MEVTSMRKDNIKIELFEREDFNYLPTMKRFYSARESFKNAMKSLRGKSNHRNLIVDEYKQLQAKSKVYTKYSKYIRVSYTNKKYKKVFKVETLIKSTDSKDKIKQIIKSNRGYIIENLQDYREGLREPKLTQRDIFIGDEYFCQSMCAGVHVYKNSILDIYNRNKIAKCFKAKKPETNDSYIGVELECFAKADMNKMALEMVNTGYANHVTIKDDGSIRAIDHYHQMEVAILCKESEYESVLTSVCKVLKANDAKVNKSCGMHVHLDMRNRNASIAYNNLFVSQPILYAMNPPSRRDNHYCAKNKDRKFTEPTRTAKGTSRRYKAINDYAYYDYKTLEVRLHAGTVNATKVVNWVKLLLSIVNFKELVVRTPIKLSSFINKFEVIPELALYVANRIEKFADANTNINNELVDYEQDQAA